MHTLNESTYFESVRRGARVQPSACLRVGLLCLALAGSLSAANSYLVHNLVADLPNIADHVDPNLVNPWGIAESATSPFWIGNNKTGTSTLYDSSGTVIPLVVVVPPPAGTAPGAVTGVIFNGSTFFTVATGSPSAFIFCTEDGTISGWNGTLDRTHAKIAVDNSASGAVYKGCALGGTTAAPQIYASNFHAGTVDVFDANFKPVTLAAGAFIDSTVPAGFAPFGIANIGGKLYVTYAKQDTAKHDDIGGAGNGYVTVFDMSGVLQSHFIAQGPLNSPWGMAIAPANFGDFAGDLLVGNFGDGMIHAFNPTTGQLIGTLNDPTAKPIVIQGLWALLFGNGGRGGDAGTLYFTAGSPGPNAEPLETHGLFGSIQAAPFFTTSSLVNAASFSSILAPNTWASIIGQGLSASTHVWQGSDFVNNQLPTQLSGVTVTLNGKPAYISYVSPTQINFLVPTDVPSGPVQVVTTNNGLTSGSITATFQPSAPSFFMFPGNKYIAATHADGFSLTGPPSLIPGATTTPAVPGETVVLYGNGFGLTSPAAPNGLIVSTPLNLATPPTLTIGGLPATITFSGLSATGLYQINAIVPAVPTNGATPVDAAVVAQVPGAQSQPNAFLSITSPSAPPAPALVDIVNFSFVPTPITVTAGSTVTWTNKDAVQHNVVSDANVFASDLLDTGVKFTQQLNTPGTYNYHCSVHPNMKATVIVK